MRQRWGDGTEQPTREVWKFVFVIGVVVLIAILRLHVSPPAAQSAPPRASKPVDAGVATEPASDDAAPAEDTPLQGPDGVQAGSAVQQP